MTKRSSPASFLVLASALLATTACGERREATANGHSRPASQAPSAAPSANPTLPPEAPPAPADASADEPAAVVSDYYRDIDRGDYDAAYRRWERGGAASGKDFADFRAGFADTRHTAVETGSPGRIEGAAGSLYVTIPVTVRAALADGTRQHFAGSYVLRRIDDVPGSGPSERRWHLYSATLAPSR